MFKLIVTGIVLFATVGTSGCSSAENDLVGIWKATSVDMSFAEGRIPADKMDEAAREMIEKSAPAFDLNSDGTARVFGGVSKCSGTWSVQGNIVNVRCTDDSIIQLEKTGKKLVTLPDRTFTFEVQ